MSARNLGPGTIEISKLKVSCACTDVRIDRRSLGPGQSATISASVRIGDRHDANSVRIVVESNDPVEPKSVITAEWRVMNPLHAEDDRVDFARLSPNEATERILPIYIEDLGVCRSRELRAQTRSRAISCRLDEKDHVGSELEGHRGDSQRIHLADLTVSVLAQDQEGHFRDAVELDLTCGGELRASLTLPVSWSVTPPINVSPSRVFVGTTEPGQRIENQINLYSTTGDQFQVQAILGDRLDDDLDFPDLSDLMHSLDFAVTTPTEEGPWRTFVTVETDHPECASLRIPVSGIVTGETQNEAR